MEVRGATAKTERRLPIGAEVLPGGVHFRVWAPRRKTVEVNFDAQTGDTSPIPSLPLERESDGYFSGFSSQARSGTRYGFRLDGEPRSYPDPASRRQPDGPHGSSEVVDPARVRLARRPLAGRDVAGTGDLRDAHRHVHAGRNLAGGTRELRDLAELGVTLVEVMPVAEFAGRFGWGYDGVNLFAPTRLYGEPDDFRRFVDAAHQIGLGVMLDVVYNHFGPVGQLPGPVFRELRLRPPSHRLGRRDQLRRRELGAGARILHRQRRLLDRRVSRRRSAARRGPRDRRRFARPHSGGARRGACARRPASASTLVFAENEFQDARLVRPPSSGGYGLDAAWNDDFHHAARVAMTGPRRVLLRRLSGNAAGIDLGRQVGLPVPRPMERAASEAARLAGARFARLRNSSIFLQNHDQVGNSPQGKPVARADLARTLSGHDGAVGFWRRNAAVVSGPGIFRLDALSLFCRSRGRAGRVWCAKAGRPRCGSFAASPDAMRQPAWPIPATRGRSRNAKLDPDERGAPHRTPIACTAICCACGAKTRCSRRSEPIASRAPCSPAKRFCCDTLARRGTIAWCW